MSIPAVRTVSDLRQSLDFPVPDSFASSIGGSVASFAGKGRIPLIYPATGEQWAFLAAADAAEVDAAIQNARQAFHEGAWSALAVPQRQAILRRVGELILQHARELATLECLCSGLPLQHLLKRQMPRAAENFFFFADLIGNKFTEKFAVASGYSATVSRQPAGVAAVLSPWNASLALASMQIASCIAFGNSCVSKPSEHAPAAVLRLGELLTEAGVPNGVVNILCGGPQTGKLLVRHPGVDRIAFIGKTSTGKEVMGAAAKNLTPVNMGLSAKSANLVFADADLARAVAGSAINAFSNSGQICVAGSRILVQESIAKEFIGSFVSRVSELHIGDPMDRATDIGPLGFAEHRDRVLEYMQMATEGGVDILLGGKAIGSDPGRCFVQPTVVLVKNNQLPICQEEVFGPFVTIQVFKELEDAIRICNDSIFGLLAYAWTGSQDLAAKLETALNVGSLFINTSLIRDLSLPFGGFKESGLGRDGPQECADFYTETKTMIKPVDSR